ncbi:MULTISPECIES: nucleoside-diphosphate sugar epimerase/dehydratase [unclassified Pseudomonas]|uniref:polysaccharide biosynthesis protein n=1 Tax=unclassified Pseudomonas TaxID=196821 RepID=UPI000BCE0AC0|nr:MULTISPECIES: nucleoside-diphosphate sugar epimerase/dehydratase [unclassified Pseudomonas]PVZ16460.1 FlaA1/EpsC-like NDP-sugar epimerase [Pseudomonas sp. URIL14HWK12:I12]PVZ25684.1 FlaA1/EpsC-like NDP-sugar epimerase [Pseudomonas sp. URIL14HWK12:I10]PVZ36792.1 FlaA1/EpsC-like NDP-sugar epimerase [Pseudomonas sp. URIL14HWK12:I11]SNZ12604.1 NDP-sugar epimerase, includes UDP-GlcNAc-inverting 4,6-dehydratase FlaA1 and capsular polysaccharide biosynthesis protein EpsC [Pseudomonas sp. URIL14HWK1
MESFKAWLLALPRRQKRLVQVVLDSILLSAALWLSFLVRLGVDDLFGPLIAHWPLFLAAPLVSVPVFVKMGMYRAVLRYFGNDALVTIFKAVTLATLILGVVLFWYGNRAYVVPRSIIFNYWWLSLVMIGGLRLAMRQYLLGGWFAVPGLLPFGAKADSAPRVAIYGAGSAGNQLVAALRMSRCIRPVAFIDDDPQITSRVISGLPVYAPRKIASMIQTTGATEILLALPSVSRSRRREILGLLETHPVHVRTIPAYSDLANGRFNVDDIREVEIADLLGRDAVPAQPELLARCVVGKTVMVTGAGGSIGSELCRQILAIGPARLILFEHSEFNLYSVNAELEAASVCLRQACEIIPILGSVRDAALLGELMTTWQVQTVYHAAAYKHVPIVEHNVGEGFYNNVFGTLRAAQAALRSGVEHFVLISTDKAVRPTNVMGSTKRLAELVLQALSQEPAPVLYGEGENVSQVNRTQFTMVRFGNVLGSSGSVIPLFTQQIKAGGPVTVTHPEITRYFMTIPEAAQLVIQAGSMGRGGDVFVLDMGEPVRIVELARKMIHLAGLTVCDAEHPDGDIEIAYSGLRPGEKLYEELLIGDDVEQTSHPMIMTALETHLGWDVLKVVLSRIEAMLAEGDMDGIRTLLTEVVNGYTPQGGIVDLKFLHKRGAN